MAGIKIDPEMLDKMCIRDRAGNVLKQAILGTDGECLESSTRYDLKDRATHRTNPARGVTRYLYDLSLIHI